MSETPVAAVEPWTTARLLRWTTEFLAKAGVDEPRLSAELLLAHALGWAKIDLYTRFNEVPGEDQRRAFRELVRRAAAHEPIAYLIGRKEFYSLAFEVTPDVLIPRPETETLVERVVLHGRQRPGDGPRFLDLGTGSGCVAIAILSQLPEARAVGSDVSEAALQIARRNAERHRVLDRLELIEADGLRIPAEAIPPGGFDLIVSNPPYVADEQCESLPENVRRYEPAQALFAGPDGLRFYRLLHDDGPVLLQPGGSIFVEIGAGLAPAVREVFDGHGAFTHAGTWRDPTDPHDRVMRFIRTGNGSGDR